MTEPRPERDQGRLIVYGKDQPGIVAAVSTILTDIGASMISLDQHSTGPEGGRFFQRAVFHLPRFTDRRPALEVSLHRALRTRLGLEWSLVETTYVKKAAVFVSKLDHCMLELLWRQRRGELPLDLAGPSGHIAPMRHLRFPRRDRGHAPMPRVPSRRWPGLLRMVGASQHLLDVWGATSPA